MTIFIVLIPKYFDAQTKKAKAPNPVIRARNRKSKYHFEVKPPKIPTSGSKDNLAPSKRTDAIDIQRKLKNETKPTPIYNGNSYFKTDELLKKIVPPTPERKAIKSPLKNL